MVPGGEHCLTPINPLQMMAGTWEQWDYAAVLLVVPKALVWS